MSNIAYSIVAPFLPLEFVRIDIPVAYAGFSFSIYSITGDGVASEFHDRPENEESGDRCAGSEESENHDASEKLGLFFFSSLNELSFA